MDEVVTSKTFLIYIPPSEEVSNLIEKANIVLRPNHPNNTYIPLYKGKWYSHLMVYLSPMPVTETENIINAVNKITNNISRFTVKLSDIEMADANYLQVRIDRESQVFIRSIREKLVEVLLPYRDKTIKSKYLQKWDSFSDDEKVRIKTTGIPYVYEPHLTIGVFGDTDELKQAYEEVKQINFTGENFEANKIEILTSFGNDYNNKEIILSKNFK